MSVVDIPDPGRLYGSCMYVAVYVPVIYVAVASGIDCEDIYDSEIRMMYIWFIYLFIRPLIISRTDREDICDRVLDIYKQWISLYS